MSRDGSVDWLCFPRFDSGACFAALLGSPDNGRWLLAPAGAGDATSAATSTTRSSSRRPGRPTTGGRARPRLHAAARQGARHRPHRRGCQGPRRLPLRAHDPLRLRRASCRGCASGRTRTNTRVAIAGPDALCFRTPVDDARRGHADGLGVHGRRGRARPVRPHVVPVARGRSRAGSTRSRRSRDTESFWREWSEACPLDLPGDWAPLVRRSLIVLKALTYDADRRDRRRADDVAAGVDRRRCATGTTATAGCVTRRSRCSRSCTATTPRRRRRGGAG